MIPRITFVSNFVPGNGYTGFGVRLHAFLNAASEVAEVSLITPSDRQDSGEPFALLEDSTYRWLPLTTAANDAVVTAIGSLRARVQRYPSSRFEHLGGVLRVALRKVKPNLVVFHLECGQLARIRIGDTPAIFVLEERREELSPVTGLKSKLGERNRARQWRAMYRLIGREAGPVVVISDEEHAGLSQVIDPYRLAVIPHFVPRLSDAAASPSRSVDVGIFGDLSLRRNWLPAIEVTEACRHMGLSVGLFGRSGPEVDRMASTAFVSGAVDDLRPWFEAARVVIVPRHLGSGVKTTALEAWAAGRPLVIDQSATRGLRVRHGYNALIASSLTEAARLAHQLIVDHELGRALVSGGYATLDAAHSAVTAETAFAELCRAMLSTAVKTRPGR